ncbi:DUF6191 domain-containing protein [Streptomyces sp. NPDC056656]|uniref:DUF6191 domain-containing protein n=1 Tax=Streptomyces sp. NPDC056656 TaxID=3345895 RepID=UPI00369A1DA5
MFEELFSPGRKHTNEERKRLELTRVDLNDGDPGRGPIDLTSGKVVVRVHNQTPPDPTEGPQTAATEPPESAEPAPEASATPTTDPGRDPSHDSAPDPAPTAPSDDET